MSLKHITKIKICGLYRSEDIEYVNEALPDFAGFIFYPKSHRFVSRKRASELIKNLDSRIKTVGVFVDNTPQEVSEIVNTAGINIVQLHGSEDNTVIDEVKKLCPSILEVWKAIRIKNSFDINVLKNIDHADRYLADAYVEGYGGQGKSFDARLVNEIDRNKLIIAGGLNENNIKSTIRLTTPYAIDLSSGVETDRKKDRNKIIAAVNSVRY